VSKGRASDTVTIEQHKGGNDEGVITGY